MGKNGWWYGHIQGTAGGGWFPKDYVRLEEKEAPLSTAAKSATLKSWSAAKSATLGGGRQPIAFTIEVNSPIHCSKVGLSGGWGGGGCKVGHSWGEAGFR